MLSAVVRGTVGVLGKEVVPISRGVLHEAASVSRRAASSVSLESLWLGSRVGRVGMTERTPWRAFEPVRWLSTGSVEDKPETRYIPGLDVEDVASEDVEYPSEDIHDVTGFPFTKETMHETRPGVSVNLAEADANFQQVHAAFKRQVDEQKQNMMPQVMNGWLDGIKSAFGSTSEGTEALNFLQRHLMGDLYSGAVNRAVLRSNTERSLSPDAKAILMRSLQTLKSIHDRTLTSAATRVVRQDFYKGVETWDPISAVAFVDVTDVKAKVTVLKSMMTQYGGDRAWLDAMNVATRQQQGSIKHYTSHPSSSYSKETAQADSDLVVVLAKKNGTETLVEHGGKFVPADIDTSDAHVDKTAKNLTLLLLFEGASPKYDTPYDNWVQTIQEHIKRDLRWMRLEVYDLLQAAADVQDRETVLLDKKASLLEKDTGITIEDLDTGETSTAPSSAMAEIDAELDALESQKEYLRLMSRSLAEETNSWHPDVDSRPADVGAMARIKARLTQTGIHHDRRLVRMLGLPSSGAWEKALQSANGIVERGMRQIRGQLNLMVQEVNDATTPKEVLKIVRRHIPPVTEVYRKVQSIHRQRQQELRELRREAIADGDFLTEMKTRVGISASMPGSIGEQVRFAHDAMKGLVDAFRTGRPIGNAELNRCLAILEMHKEMGLNMFVVAESDVSDHSDIAYLMSKLGSNGSQTHSAPLRERPEAYSEDAVRQLVQAIRNGDVATVRALFIGDSDSRGDGEGLAGAVTADTHRMASGAGQSVYRGVGDSKSRGLHVEGGAGEMTYDRVIRDGALRVRDVKKKGDEFKVDLLPIAYTMQPHRATMQLTQGSTGDSRFQGIVTALFPFQKLTPEYSGHIVTSLMPTIDASVKVGEKEAYNEMATAILERLKDFMATLAKRPNTRSDYTRIIDGVPLKEDTTETETPRFAERVRAVQQAACEYTSPYQSMGLVRQLETFRYIATMDPAGFDVFKESPTGFQFKSLVKRYPVLSEVQLEKVEAELLHLGVSEESTAIMMADIKESVSLLLEAREKYGITLSAEEAIEELESLEAKEVFAKLVRDEHMANGPSPTYFALMTNFLAASGA
jgi:hypothetical protein